MYRQSNYDKFPFVAAGPAEECSVGWQAIAARLAPVLQERKVACIECYPGVFTARLSQKLRPHLPLAAIFLADQCLKPPEQLRAMLDPLLGTDRVFGHMSDITIDEYLDPAKLAAMRFAVEHVARDGPVLVAGAGASLMSPPGATLIYADLARWEIQLRWRRGEIGNLGLNNPQEDFSLKYKCGFFTEWRAADRLKRALMPKIDFLLDTNLPDAPKLISGDAFRRALQETAQRPFRVVPYFDPGPWGGHWMEEVCDLPHDVPNHAWCFDCVPEENSLLLGFGEHRVEVPAIDLVFQEPEALLGDAVFARFGAEFPIRFDFLDTMGGGNLSLQVHPLTEYIREKFGMNYTQDESYYLLDAGPDATVYLGLKENISRKKLIADLYHAQEGGEPFPAEKFVNRWPARKHDHFLIPAGTIHCSGANSMVLEISATPYIFTFKLWDWGRLGLDGRPRPIHIEYGVANIQWDRTTEWVWKELINRFETIREEADWFEERTGLHEKEFIETRRHWFTGAVPHHTEGGVNVLNLVEGDEVIVESPTDAFEPFVVHYVETFIVPAAAGAYTIRPNGISAGKRCGTIKAFVRNSPE
ncbi:Mannose-6-phosphate isomerase-like protein [Candidatus Sulfotelmatomonas gaucii]|uniref:Mannose-6-phosphate isomerase-like protein n=1 Tax=Candidatus Sulfuritelmatomonas gaucii TaxID=2043161 RepID=A0A2N9MAD0_9BACT|nr:Mannose-6-phosphate isomerase-like protein [Candidatus Sulfotelmatomonas gaucii]